MKPESALERPFGVVPRTPVDALEFHVYAGTAGHSVWFSDDLGQTWVHPNSHSGMYLEARVWAFSSHPDRPEHVYAGTDAGVYRWLERSARWEHCAPGLGDVWALAHDPKRPSTLFAGTRPAGLFRSDDDGVSWTELPVPGIARFSEVNMGPTRVTQILFDPFEEDVMWATIEIGGIYRSDDRGNTWRQFTDGLVSSDVHGIAVVRAPTGTIRVLATTNRGLHVSEDRGLHWQFVELDTPWQYMRCVVVHPLHSSTVFLANGNGPPGNDGRLFRSVDGGREWERLTLPGELNSTVWCVAVHPSDPALIFICTNLGQVFRSTDAGQSWLRTPHEFGELRSLHWRAVPRGTRAAAHSVTRAVAPKPALPVDR